MDCDADGKVLSKQTKGCRVQDLRGESGYRKFNSPLHLQSEGIEQFVVIFASHVELLWLTCTLFTVVWELEWIASLEEL